LVRRTRQRNLVAEFREPKHSNTGDDVLLVHEAGFLTSDGPFIVVTLKRERGGN
jgi:hypothetical protein